MRLPLFRGRQQCGSDNRPRVEIGECRGRGGVPSRSGLIPQGYGLSLARTGGYSAAPAAFLTFSLTCLGATWWFYLRERGTETAPAQVASEPV